MHRKINIKKLIQSASLTELENVLTLFFITVSFISPSFGTREARQRDSNTKRTGSSSYLFKGAMSSFCSVSKRSKAGVLALSFWVSNRKKNYRKLHVLELVLLISTKQNIVPLRGPLRAYFQDFDEHPPVVPSSNPGIKALDKSSFGGKY